MTMLNNQPHEQSASENAEKSAVTISADIISEPDATVGALASASDGGEEVSRRNVPIKDDDNNAAAIVVDAVAEELSADTIAADASAAPNDDSVADYDASAKNGITSVATGNIEDEAIGKEQQQNDRPLDQPTKTLSQHSTPSQSPLSALAPSQKDENDTNIPSINMNTSNNETPPPTQHPTRNTKPNYTSAPTRTLGNDSDKDDFRRGVVSANPTDTVDSQREGPSNSSEVDNNNSDTALSKLKQWFTSSPTNTHGEENGENDYRNFSSPKRDRNGNEENANNGIHTMEKEGMKKISLDDNLFDESLLDEEGNGEGDVELGKVASKIPTKRSWGKSSFPNTTATKEEERVMGECSFFYDMDNIEGDEIATPKTSHRQNSHRIPGTEPRTMNANDDDVDDDEAKGYLEQSHPHYRRRRVLHLAQAIKTRAKRRWTERRYRRRLRQSRLGLPRHSWNGAPTDPDGGGGAREFRGMGGDGADDDEEFYAYELTTEHRRAFNAAHAALNGKVANEYGRNRHAIRKQYGYDRFDLECDLDLEEDGNGEANGGGNDNEIRADLTKSSLAIRGGLIRLPADNVRLVCDAQLQPGILSIETRDVQRVDEKDGDGSGGNRGVVGYENFGNANRYGNIHGSGMMAAQQANSNDRRHRRSSSKESLAEHHMWSRNELAYVLTVDEQIYRRVVQEMGDSYRVPGGMYYCCHESRSGDHVGIGVAVALLLVVFLLLVLGMIAWPTW